jgi:hypothetical protein
MITLRHNNSTATTISSRPAHLQKQSSDKFNRAAGLVTGDKGHLPTPGHDALPVTTAAIRICRDSRATLCDDAGCLLGSGTAEKSAPGILAGVGSRPVWRKGWAPGGGPRWSTMMVRLAPGVMLGHGVEQRVGDSGELV